VTSVPRPVGADRPAVRVRRATAEDFDRVATLTVDAYAADGQLAVEVGYARVLADVPARAAAAEVLVAEIDDSGIVGAVAFVLPGSPYAELCAPGEAEFRMLAVDPKVQRRGVGAALVRACIARAHDVGARAIVICTRDFTVTAHRLYERLGFVRTPERDWSPLPGVDLLALRLDLQPTDRQSADRQSADGQSADEVEGDVERGGPALVVGDVRVADDEPAGVQGEDRQR
jgi:ribosomal protein S18 acetylase RimI-like enzyme